MTVGPGLRLDEGVEPLLRVDELSPPTSRQSLETYVFSSHAHLPVGLSEAGLNPLQRQPPGQITMSLARTELKT